MSDDEMTIDELTEEECTEENEEDGYSELDELFGRGEEEEDDEEEDEGCYGEIAKKITVIAQPIKTTVRVGAEKDSKGNVKPSCSFSIERNLTDDTDEFEVIDNDFDSLIERVKEVMKSFKEE